MRRCRWVAALALVLLVASCDDLPRHEITLSFDDSGEHVTIAAETKIPEKGRDDARTQRLREDLVAYRDEWSLRFANANPAEDRMLYERSHGTVVRVEHVARIDADDLQKFFFDVPISATVMRGPGWAELTIYPGASTRATRQQREEVDRKLQLYARRAVEYFGTVRAMYAYLDDRPQRAEELFKALFRDDDDARPLLLTDVEMNLVDATRKALTGMAFFEDETEDLEREADLVFNPFPATLVVRVPTEPLMVEGFAREEKGTRLVAQTKRLLDAVASLEGRWISPDPLAFAIRSDSKGLEDLAPVIAAEPRRASAVIGEREVADALRERMRPAERYRVRFVTRAEAHEP